MMKKRLLALLLAVTLTFGILPTVWAVETDPMEEPTVPETTAAAEEPTVPETTEAAEPVESETDEDSQPEETEIVPGDADAIVAGLNALEAKLDSLTYADCDGFFAEMMDVYAYAFRNNFPLVTTEEMIRIDAKFDALETQLMNKFGYSSVGTTARPFSTFSLRTRSGVVPTAEGENSGVVVDKTVASNGESEVGDFTLTLEAYVTGEISQIEITQPSDIVMVLDQSASMYAPIGAQKSFYTSTEADKNAIDALNLTSISPENIDTTKASQLGYYIAHSTNLTSHLYCTTCDTTGKVNKADGSTDDCPNGQYDWFVIHYDADTTDADSDSDITEQVWKFYRIPYTSCPINDSDAWAGNHDLPAMSAIGDIVTDDLKSIGVNGYKVYQTQYGALYDAIGAFVNSMSDMHRVAVVGFASAYGYADGSPLDVGNQKGHGGTGVYVNGEFKPAYGTDTKFTDTVISDDSYASALTSGKDKIMANVKAVKTDYYGTNHNLGLDLANNILANAPAYMLDGKEIETNKVVILFTDGVPSGDDDDFIRTDTVAKAKTLKTEDDPETEEVEGYGATVYSIWTSTLTSGYDFLEKASSDYTVDETEIEEPKYSMGVSSADALTEAFQAAMKDTSAATITLNQTAVLKDVLTQYFVLPDKVLEAKNLADHIKVYTADYTGETDDNGDKLWKDAVSFTSAMISLEKDENGKDRKIKVTGFDYSANYVADLGRQETEGGDENFYGRKLIVEIPIEPNPDFVGGDDVVTNTTESGIYTEDGNPVIKFPVPDVNIDVLKIKPVFQSQDIYLSQMANLSTILNLGVFQGEDGNTYKIDGINNAYSDIVYTITDPNGNLLTCTIPAGTSIDELTNLNWSYNEELGDIAPLLKEDTRYIATCTVTSTNNENNTSSDESEQLVRVFKPVITFHDSEIQMGDTPNYAVDNFVSVVWKHDDAEANAAVMGSAPTLEYTYEPAEAALNEETEVKVSVEAQANGTSIPINQNITQYVTFYRDACTIEDCDHAAKTVVDAKNENRVNFVVHMKKFNLKIQKQGADMNLDPNTAFVFHVTGPNEFEMDVVVYGNGSVTISNLPAGVYTVTEQSGWSWRYTPDELSKTGSAADAVDGTTNVTFNNTRTKTQWMDGSAYNQNIFD